MRQISVGVLHGEIRGSQISTHGIDRAAQKAFRKTAFAHPPIPWRKGGIQQKTSRVDREDQGTSGEWKSELANRLRAGTRGVPIVGLSYKRCGFYSKVSSNSPRSTETRKSEGEGTRRDAALATLFTFLSSHSSSSPR